MQYIEVQNIAKKTIEFIKDKIQPGMTLVEVRHLCETKMLELGADSFWYWDVGAFVFAGDETTLSVSGKEYTTSTRIIAENDIIFSLPGCLWPPQLQACLRIPLLSDSCGNPRRQTFRSDPTRPLFLRHRSAGGS